MEIKNQTITKKYGYVMVLGYNHHNKMIAATVPATTKTTPRMDWIRLENIMSGSTMVAAAAAVAAATTTTIIISTRAAIVVTPIIIIINNYKKKMLHTRRPKIRFSRSTRCTV